MQAWVEVVHSGSQMLALSQISAGNWLLLEPLPNTQTVGQERGAWKPSWVPGHPHTNMMSIIESDIHLTGTDYGNDHSWGHQDRIISDTGSVASKAKNEQTEMGIVGTLLPVLPVV